MPPPATFDPFADGFARDPYRHYAALRDESPVFRSERFDMTFLTRYRDIVRALTDSRLGREPPAESSDGLAAGDRGMPSYDRFVRVNLLETEGAAHERLRRLLSQALNPRRVGELAVRVRDLSAALIGKFAARIASGETVDFLAAVAEPLPVTVIAELLGWPEAERYRLRPWSADIVRLYESDATPDDALRAEQACREFALMLDELANRRKRKPQKDLISALAALEDGGSGLTRDELIANCMLLLNAGHEATVNAAGNGLLALLDHPSELARLRERPELLDRAIEEMLRFEPPLHIFHRYAGEDLELDGVVVPAGGKVGLLYGSANRDPEAFPDPDRFDIARHPNRHLAFGAATHFCLGAPLARLELRSLFGALLERCGRLEACDAAPAWRRGLVFRGLSRLPLRSA